MKLSPLALHFSILLVPALLVCQPLDSSRVDSLRRDGSVLSGSELHRRSPASLVRALRWETAVTQSDDGWLGYRNAPVSGEHFLVDGLVYGDRFAKSSRASQMGGVGGATFFPTPSLLSIASVALRSSAGVTRRARSICGSACGSKCCGGHASP